MTELDDSWLPDLQQNGILRRQAARVILFDRENRLLLLHGHDSDDPTYQWWFTVGGGLEAGETAKQAAVREVAEETGVELHECDLEGPILRRQAKFYFVNQTVLQDEEFFLAKLTTVGEAVDDTGHTAIERKTVDGYRWMTLAELVQRSATELVFPRTLPLLVKQWSQGWDGNCLQLDE